MFFNSTKPSTRHTTRTNTCLASNACVRLVTSNRWVNSDLLEVGMYVNELDKPWEETRFVFQGFTIDSYETLRAVQQACKYANVQTEKEALIPSNSSHRLVGNTRGANIARS